MHVVIEDFFCGCFLKTLSSLLKFNNSLDPCLDSFSEVISSNSEADKAMYPDALNFAERKDSIFIILHRKKSSFSFYQRMILLH